MITAEVLATANIPLDSDAVTLLNVQSALEYITGNTTLKVDESDLSSLPAAAKLFIVKFTEVMGRTGVTSERVDDLSQSFDTTSTDAMLLSLLNSLLGKYAKSQMQVVQCEKRWNYGC